MFKRVLALGLFFGSLMATSGCAYNSVVGHHLVRSGRMFGEVGISGNLNTVTIQRDSRLSELSVIGDANLILVEDGVAMPKVEIWGQNNVVEVPQRLIVRMTEVGKNNRLVYRNAGQELGSAVPPSPAPRPIPNPENEPGRSTSVANTPPPPPGERAYWTGESDVEVGITPSTVEPGPADQPNSP